MVEHDPRRGVAIAAGTDQGEDIPAGCGRDLAGGYPVREPVSGEFRHGYLWLGDKPTAVELVGGGIAIAGVIVASRRPARAPAPGECTAEPVADL